MMLRFVLSSVAVLTFSLPIVGATEFIVSQRDPGASDDNSGSREKPLKTISAASARVQAGDKVVIRGGQYRETVIINASGTVEAPIVFEAAPGENPVIKGSEILKDWIRENGEIWKAKLPLIAKRSTEIRDPSFWLTNDVRLVFVKDSALLDALHLRRVTAQNQLQPGTFFRDISNNLLFVWLSNSSDPNNHTMEVAVRGAWLYVFGSNITIRGIQMRHSSTLGIINWPACSLGGNNIVLEDCTLTWSDFAGVGLGGNRNKLLRCTVACHGNSGLGGAGEGHVIEKCRIIYNNMERYDPNWHCGGAKLIPRFNHGRVAHTEFAHNIGAGLWLDDGCTDNLIEGNFCHDNEGPGIMVEASAGNHLFNNICVGNRNILAGDFLSPDAEAVKQNEHNKFQTVHRDAELRSQPIYHAGDGRGIYISSSPQTQVYHNTCYLNEGEGICVEGGSRQTSGEAPMSTRDCAVLNNICVYNKGTQLVVRRNDNDKETHGNRSDYNVLLALGAVFAQAGWDGPFVLSLKDWQQRTGNDGHSIEADPDFAMAAMNDFRLLPISPAIRAGQPLEEVRDDFWGSPRPKEKVSIGACEGAAFDYPRPALSPLNNFPAP